VFSACIKTESTIAIFVYRRQTGSGIIIIISDYDMLNKYKHAHTYVFILYTDTHSVKTGA